MNKAEKQRQIEAGERVRCLVPFCNRTSKLSEKERLQQLEHRKTHPEWSWEWICSPHWRNVPPKFRRAHLRFFRKRGHCWPPFWKRCVDEAVTRGGLNG